MLLVPMARQGWRLARGAPWQLHNGRLAMQLLPAALIGDLLGNSFLQRHPSEAAQ